MIPFFLGAAGGAPVASQVFATTLYTGNGSSQTIANGIDTDLAWIKARSEAWDHALCDQLRGINAKLRSNSTINELTGSGSVTAFGTTGFTVGSQDDVNRNLVTYVAWSFARAARFFDVVTWTGDGSSNRQIAHSLGIAPGLILVKSRSGVRHWTGQHRSLGPTQDIVLSLANAAYSEPNAWNNTAPTSANFTVGSYTSANNNLETYVAYLFAHDTASDGIVQCGSYTGNGSASGPTVTLGWRPQFVMVKRASGGTGNWVIFDTARGIPAGNDPTLCPNSSAAEDGVLSAADYIDLTATGFTLASADTNLNNNTDTYVFMAVRSA
jgi:hypothetical protein